MPYDVFMNASRHSVTIAKGKKYPDGSTATAAALAAGAHVIEYQGEITFAAPVLSSHDDIELRIPAGSRLVVAHADPNYGIGAFGLAGVTIGGRGRIVAPQFVPGQTLVAIAAVDAEIGGGLTIDLAASDGAGAPMKAVWLNGCTSPRIVGLRVLPNRNMDAVVVDGGSRLWIDDLLISNGTAGTLESYIPRRARTGVTINNCFGVSVDRFCCFGLGTTLLLGGEDLPLRHAMQINADPGLEHGHVDIRGFENYAFNCEIGLWLRGCPWVNIGDGCYFCTQGILCRELDHCAILLDSHDSTDASTKRCGPVTIGKVHVHNTGLGSSSGIYVKRARDVTIRGACVTDIRNACAVRIETPFVRNVAIDALTALLAPDAGAAALAPIVLAPGVADGIAIGRVQYGRQVADDGVGPSQWNGIVPIHGMAGVGGTLRTRGLWDAAEQSEPTNVTTMQNLTSSVPMS